MPVLLLILWLWLGLCWGVLRLRRGLHRRLRLRLHWRLRLGRRHGLTVLRRGARRGLHGGRRVGRCRCGCAAVGRLGLCRCCRSNEERPEDDLRDEELTHCRGR